MGEPEKCMEPFWPLAVAVALEIGRLGELNKEGRNSHATDALRSEGHWSIRPPRRSTLSGSHRILDPDRVGADTALLT
jgi:hypothetical protein